MYPASRNSQNSWTFPLQGNIRKLTIFAVLAAHEAGAAAARAELLKEETYADLLHTREFNPVIAAAAYLIQCLSIAVK